MSAATKLPSGLVLGSGIGLLMLHRLGLPKWCGNEGRFSMADIETLNSMHCIMCQY